MSRLRLVSTFAAGVTAAAIALGWPGGVGPLAAKHGGFAPAISVDASRLYTVRDGIDDIQAAMLEPIAVCVHALRRTELRLGDQTRK